MCDDEKNLEIIKCLRDSINLFYKNDNILIRKNIHEQDISHRIAYYFENLLRLHNVVDFKEYSVDVEYNRDGFDVKELSCDNDNCENKDNCCFIRDYLLHNDKHSVRPDIVLHQRGNNENNLLVIEIKKEKNANSKKCKADFAKLSAYTCTKLQYKYKRGLWLDIATNKTKCNCFIDGKKQGVCEWTADK